MQEVDGNAGTKWNDQAFKEKQTPSATMTFGKLHSGLQQMPSNALDALVALVAPVARVALLAHVALVVPVALVASVAQ